MSPRATGRIRVADQRYLLLGVTDSVDSTSPSKFPELLPLFIVGSSSLPFSTSGDSASTSCANVCQARQTLGSASEVLAY